MNHYVDQFFPADFINDYVAQNANGLQRLQIYSIFRFLSACEKNNQLSPLQLQKKLGYSLPSEAFDVISNYLSWDFYFSPSIRENSFDLVFLYDAIYMVESDDKKGFEIIKQQMNLSQNPESDFFAKLSLLAFEQPALLSEQLESFSSIYNADWNFSSEDFVLYNFMDEYFEIENCRNLPAFKELVDTLAIATLKAFDTTLEQCVLETAGKQLSHPSSKFAGLYRHGALDCVPAADITEDCAMFKHLLEYAVTYELRSNLFDFHLEEERLITLANWKEKLKWYHIQYSNAYELAISSFYAASLSRKLLKLQFNKNLSDLT